MWKNMVQPDRPQMTIWRMRLACGKNTHTHTHTLSLSLSLFLSLRLRNTYGFSNVTMVTRKRLNVTLCIHFLSSSKSREGKWFHSTTNMNTFLYYAFGDINSMNLLVLLHEVFTFHIHLSIRFTVDQRNVQNWAKNYNQKSHTTIMITMALRFTYPPCQILWAAKSNKPISLQ
jgi:hypothetical protein